MYVFLVNAIDSGLKFHVVYHSSNGEWSQRQTVEVQAYGAKKNISSANKKVSNAY